MMRSSSVLTIAGALAIVASPTAAVNAAESVGLSFDLDLTNPSAKLADSASVLFSPLEQTDANTQPPANLSTGTPASQKSFPSTKTEAQVVAEVPANWWTQGSASPLSVAIGAAEGTRTTDGGKTSAYYWHSDPGNQADNFGTFSYQHLPPQQKQVVTQAPTTEAKRAAAAEAKLPELADQQQLQKLKRFHDQLRQQALDQGLALSELELINGLDLANQSEAASLSKQGYIDRLAQMKQLIPGDPEEQIREARTWSYWSPERNTWDAPGLGNTYDNIRRDQSRRMAAIQQSLHQYQTPLTNHKGQIASASDFEPKQSDLEQQTFEEFQQEYLNSEVPELPQELRANEQQTHISAMAAESSEPDIQKSQSLASSKTQTTTNPPTLDFGSLPQDPAVYRETAIAQATQTASVTQAELEQRANDIIFYELEAADLSASRWI